MDHVLSGLISKRTDIKSEIGFLKNKLQEMENILNCLDVSIKVFNPDFDLNTVKDKKYKQNSSYFKQGELHTLVLDILRKSKEPLMTKNIAEEVMKIKGLDISDNKLFFSIQHTLYATLKRQKTSKIIYSIKDFGEAEKFKIA